MPPRGGGNLAFAVQSIFYLRGDGFWHNHPCAGQDAVLRALSAPPGIKAFQAISDYVFRNDELFALLRDPVTRSQLRSVLINRYFLAFAGDRQLFSGRAKSNHNP
jgi:hypothetical protein